MNIVTFSEKRVALAFSDYLRSLDIANQIETTEAGFVIAVEQAAHTDAALAEAQAFAANPNDAKYWQASWATGQVQKQPVYAKAPSAISAAWWQRSGWCTRGVALICVLVFIGLNLDGDAVFNALQYPDGISVNAINGQWWRLLTPALVHFGIMHIVFNLLWWWELGGLVERAQSGARLLALTLVIALVSNAAQFLSYGTGFGGLSAVVYGVLGYLWLYPLADPSAPFRLRGSIVIFMVGWLALGYTGIFDKLFGTISNNGHLAGLIVGSALGVLLGLVNRGKSAQENIV
jgi:GlpG protein